MLTFEKIMENLEKKSESRQVSMLQLSDSRGQAIVKSLRSHPGVYLGCEFSSPCFVEAVLWLDRSGSQWRYLPDSFGKRNCIYKRFNRCCRKGIWEVLCAECAVPCRLESNSKQVGGQECADFLEK